MAPTADPLPLVGREDDVAMLCGMLTAAAGGVGGTACIVGPAGIGKTRLAAEVLRIARIDGFRCAWSAGWPDGGAPPLWPWQSVLEQLGVATFGVSAPGNDQERFVAFRAVADALGTAARDQPLLIVIDDAHTIDVGALLLVRFLARTLRASSVQIVLTMRPVVDLDESRAAVIDDLAREMTIVKVAPLTLDAVRDLVCGLDTESRDLDGVDAAMSVDELHQLSGGNPWYVHGLLGARAGSPELSRLTSVQAIARLRLEAVPTEARGVLACIALLGPRATLAIVADVVAADAPNVARLIRLAGEVGVITVDDEVCRFTHDVLADAVWAELDDAARAAMHDRIANVLEHAPLAPAGAADKADRVVAVAHHRLTAVSIRLDRVALADAVSTCRVAADALRTGLAYEAASAMLMETIELHARFGLDVPVPLLLDLARTELVSGNLLAARSWYRRAADSTDDPIELATAAVGLGGIWVHEHRTAADHAAFMALLERARDALGDRRPDLAARIGVRLACERVYVGSGSPAEVRDACRAAYDMGDSMVAAEALSLRHHTLLGPANTGPARLQLADELVRTAAAAGDEVLGLMGVLWRAIDLLLMGDERAERAVAEARERADALKVGAVLFVLDAIDVMRLIRRGRVDEAEVAAHRCFQLGTSIGDADAVGYLGGHLLTIKWLQQRPHEVVELARQVADSPTLVEGDVAPRAAAAVLAAMTGDFDRARADLHHVMRRLPRNADVSSNWMIDMFCAAETASLVGDGKTAEMVYSSLLPYRHLPIMGSVGVVCLGSAERSLGVAAATAGEMHLAVHHFEQAIEQNRRLGNPVMAAIAEGDLGCALVARAEPGDLASGGALVESAVSQLRGIGLPDRADALVATAERLRRDAPTPDGEVVVFADRCRLTYGDHSVELADTVGVKRLCRLLRQPSAEWTAVDLIDPSTIVSPVVASGHDVHDTASLRSYRARLDELRGDIDDAEVAHDIGREAMLRAQLDEMLELLRPSLGLGGRSRSFTNEAERARVAVRKSLGRVFDAVREQDAEFADGLESSIRTGVQCRFEPIAAFPTVWRFVNAG